MLRAFFLGKELICYFQYSESLFLRKLPAFSQLVSYIVYLVVALLFSSSISWYSKIFVVPDQTIFFQTDLSSTVVNYI